VTANSSGGLEAAMRYLPFGGLRSSSGTLPTDKKFTGQRLDTTGLYFYNARYYDATIGRFISADIYVQSLYNPQTLNRYSYCNNNPLCNTDPTGWWTWGISFSINFSIGFSVSIGISARGDNQGHWAITSDNPVGVTNGAGVGVSFKAGFTTNDSIYQSDGSTITTVSGKVDGVSVGVGTQSNSEGELVGGVVSVGGGLSAGNVGSDSNVSQTSSNSTVICSESTFKNYSAEEFIYDMLNIFVSPEAASNFDYYYDGQYDYSFGSDCDYNFGDYYYYYYGQASTD
jgi:RHS repeat-associated protein